MLKERSRRASVCSGVSMESRSRASASASRRLRPNRRASPGRARRRSTDAAARSVWSRRRRGSSRCARQAPRDSIAQQVVAQEQHQIRERLRIEAVLDEVGDALAGSWIVKPNLGCRAADRSQIARPAITPKSRKEREDGRTKAVALTRPAERRRIVPSSTFNARA